MVQVSRKKGQCKIVGKDCIRGVGEKWKQA